MTTAKSKIRAHAKQVRAGVADREARSRRIMQRIASTEQFAKSTWIMLYVDIRSEVETRGALASLFHSEKRVVLPYCDGPRLRAVEIGSMAELEPGSFGILEPSPAVRENPARTPSLDRLELIVVPGLAFDAWGGRIGYGRGHYDRLLQDVPRRTCLVAAAFEAQLVDKVPTEPHDVRMHLIATEDRLIQCRDDQA